MDPAERLRGLSFGSERGLSPGFAPVRGGGFGGFQSGGVGVPALNPADPAFAEFFAKYIQDWSDREMAWGMAGLLEAVQRAAGVALPGTTAPGSTPFDLPTETTAPASNPALPAPAAETQRGDFQSLAAEMGVRPRKAERMARTERRANRNERANASGGTVTTGDIDEGADVAIDVSGGTARRRRKGY